MDRMFQCIKKHILFALFLIGIAGGLFIFIQINMMHITYKVNADIASEALLIREIWETKQWLPKAWFPSTEVRIIGVPNIAVPVYGVTENLQLSMGIACCVAMFLVLSAAYYLSVCVVRKRGGAECQLPAVCDIMHGDSEYLYHS